MAFHHTAKGLAALGRHGDDTLLHVNKQELAGLQALLGPVSVNPETGLPEAFQWWELVAGLAAGALTMGAGSMIAGAIEGGLAAAEAGTAAAEVGTAATTTAEAAPIVTEGVKDTAIAAEAAKDVGTTAEAAKTAATAAEAAKTAAAADPMLTAGEVNTLQGVGQQTGQKVGEVVTQQAEQQAANAAEAAAPHGFMEGAQQGMADTASAWTNPSNYTFSNAAKYGPMAMTIGGAEVAAAEAPAQQEAAQKQAQGTADLWNQNIQNTMGALGYKGDPGQFYVGPNGVLQATTPKIFTSGFGTGRAEGGLIALGNVQGAPVQVNVPEEDAGSVEQGIRSLGMAAGGYINLQPMGETTYPQALIPKAQPYAAASPQRREVVGGFSDGGFLKGPGDGMSDDIPAHIDGAEPVKLADGEFIIPADVVSILGNGSSKAGAKVLQQGLAAIRHAGTGNSQQVKQDAGRMAFERVVKKAGKKRANPKRSAGAR